MRLAFTDNRDGRVVVLLHGFPLDRSMWAEQFKGLGSEYRVVAPDLRGHGESEAPDDVYTMDQMADDVVQLLDDLAIRQPVVVGGLSMGGYVALSLVLRYPERVRGLMLMDSRAAADTPEAARTREETAATVLRERSARSLFEVMVARLFAKKTLERQPQKVGGIVAVMERTSVVGIAGALRGMAIRPDRRAELAAIRVPALVLVGEEDAISPVSEAREIAAALPSATLEIIPDAGHLAPYENPEATNAAILKFLNGLERAQSALNAAEGPTG